MAQGEIMPGSFIHLLSSIRNQQFQTKKTKQIWIDERSLRT